MIAWGKDGKSLFFHLLPWKKGLFRFCVGLRRHCCRAGRWFSALGFHCWTWPRRRRLYCVSSSRFSRLSSSLMSLNSSRHSCAEPNYASRPSLAAIWGFDSGQAVQSREPLILWSAADRQHSRYTVSRSASVHERHDRHTEMREWVLIRGGGPTRWDHISSQANWKTLEECVRGQVPRSERDSIKNINNHARRLISTNNAFYSGSQYRNKCISIYI